MRVAVASKGGSLRSEVDDRFGRCPFFVLVDSESLEFEAVRNPGVDEKDAAGIAACGMLINRGVEAVVVRNIGHNALVTLRGAGIDVYRGRPGSVASAVAQLNRGELPSAHRPTVGFQEGLDKERSGGGGIEGET
ncbi:MAG: NifB/NifX family molybdenum-iron cluster-binding protein [Deltaproteobacteria bacterium]|nr:NifB/NifX family molybdenum-iron cluster-binding protein [Deltaproteobacteria bacterium]